MPLDLSTPWHQASFDRFLHERLPQLLAEKLPLGGYQVGLEGLTCHIRLTLLSRTGDVEVVYAQVPVPDADGEFEIEGRRYVVLPTASRDDLAEATIDCVGEQCYAEIAARLGNAPADLPWTRRWHAPGCRWRPGYRSLSARQDMLWSHRATGWIGRRCTDAC